MLQYTYTLKLGKHWFRLWGPKCIIDGTAAAKASTGFHRIEVLTPQRDFQGNYPGFDMLVGIVKK
jgi:hypothetical protein